MSIFEKVLVRIENIRELTIINAYHELSIDPSIINESGIFLDIDANRHFYILHGDPGVILFDEWMDRVGSDNIEEKINDQKSQPKSEYHDNHYKGFKENSKYGLDKECIEVQEAFVVKGLPEEFHDIAIASYLVACMYKYQDRLHSKDAIKKETAKIYNIAHRLHFGKWANDD
jgi:hypothetical protein